MAREIEVGSVHRRDDGEVGIRRRRADDDLAHRAAQVFRGLIPRGEAPAAFHDHLDAVISEGDGAGLGFVEERKGAAFDHQVVLIAAPIPRDGERNAAMDGVVLQEMEQRLQVRRIIQRRDEPRFGRHQASHQQPPDAAEPVDSNHP